MIRNWDRVHQQQTGTAAGDFLGDCAFISWNGSLLVTWVGC